MIIIFGALKIELFPMLRSIHIHKTLKYGKTVIYEGFKNNQSVILIQTGMGTKNAKRAAELFEDNYPEWTKSTDDKTPGNIKVIMTGFCGATDKSIEVGDTVLYSSIKNIGHHKEKGFSLNSTLGLDGEKTQDSLLIEGSIDVTGATVPIVITDPIVKKKINNDFDVQVIDMESYWIGKKVINMNLPFTCLRIVSDGAEDTLPRYYESSANIRIAVSILLSFLRSIFNREEFRSNINAFKNIKKANSRLTEVSAELISGFHQ